MTISLNMVVRMTSEMETNIVAVERMNEYTELEAEVRSSSVPWWGAMVKWLKCWAIVRRDRGTGAKIRGPFH